MVGLIGVRLFAILLLLDVLQKWLCVYDLLLFLSALLTRLVQQVLHERHEAARQTRGRWRGP